MSSERPDLAWSDNDASTVRALPPSFRDLPAIAQYGRFELLGRLAAGGMAEIFLAREKARGGASRYLVVKRILPIVSADPHFVEMFLHEAKIAMSLSHPNICPIFEFGEQDGTYFIAMEWVNGISLAKLIARAHRDGGIDIPIALKVIAQVADALRYAHNARDEDGKKLGIVHRDVTPENIVISYEGGVKLLDFGIAKATNQVGKTQAGVLKGKFAYLAPEQYTGDGIDARTDIFALGVCMYEALACQPLYHRATEYETIAAIVLDERVPSVRDVDPDVPEAIDKVMQRALAKSRRERFQSAGELQKAIEEFLAENKHVVTSSTISSYLRRSFRDEIERGPELDRSPVLAPRPSFTPAPPELGTPAFPPTRVDISLQDDLNDQVPTSIYRPSHRQRVKTGDLERINTELELDAEQHAMERSERSKRRIVIGVVALVVLSALGAVGARMLGAL